MIPTPHILILTEPLAPPAYTPRVMTLIRRLEEDGWQVTHLHTMDRQPRKIWDKLTHSQDRAFYHYVKNKVDMKDIQLIFCSTYYYFPLHTAGRLAREYHLPLITDMRDIDEQWGETGFHTWSLPIGWLDRWAKRWYRRHNLKMRNRVLRASAAVTTVSPWHQATLAQYNPNTYCIYNGYDTTELHPGVLPVDHFDIVYMGQLHDLKLRNPEPLFEALHHMALPIHVHFYSGERYAHELEMMAERYQVRLEVHPFVPREEIIHILHRSSIVLILTSNATTQHTHGIMTTKFYEALGVMKPVLCIPSDDDVLAQAIAYTHAGIATSDREEIEQFIHEQYREWQKSGYTRQMVEHTEPFTRQYQAQQFEDLFRHSAHL